MDRIATSYSLEVRDSNLGRARYYVFSKTSRPALGPKQLQFFPGLKRPGRDFDH